MPRSEQVKRSTAVLAVPLAAAVGVAVAAVTVRRVEVTGSSMTPGIRPGDRLLAVSVPWFRQPWPRPGHIVALRDPRSPQRTLVKRVIRENRKEGTLEIRGDGPRSTDSREFGPVKLSAVIGRVVYRYWPTARAGRVG
jgi:nickel-type superoxide dismutase maturation protease